MEITINGLDTIRSAARQFIENIGSSRVFAFYGKMGAGKTTFVKALCEELGVTMSSLRPPLPSSTNILTANNNLYITSISIALRNSKRSMTWDTKSISTQGHFV